MDNKEDEKDQPALSKETKKSVSNGEQVIELNKKLTGQDGKDPEKEEKKDEKKWTAEG